MHQDKSALAGKTVRVADWVNHPQFVGFGGAHIEIEDWWDRVSGKSWMDCNGNPACLVCAVRAGFSGKPIPTDNEVLYGKTHDGLGHLVHLSEVETG